jgi:hypothetical protein
MNLRVAFYFDNSRLGKWSWTDFLGGRVAMSGTDSQILHLLSRMNRQSDVEAIGFFQDDLPDMAPKNLERVSRIEEAVSVAKTEGAKILVLNRTNNKETLQRVVSASESVNLPIVLWDQNGPSPEVRDLLASVGVVRRIVCVSKSQADCVRHHQVFNKTVVIYNSLLTWDEEHPLNETNRSSRFNKVCFLGATIPQKGFHLVARAWPEIKSSVPSAILTIIGSNRLYDRRQEVGPLGLASPEFEETYICPFFGHSLEEAQERGVEVRALMCPIEIRRILRQQQVVIVNPCVARGGSFETFCVSAIEAQAEGCVVVGGRRIGLRETVLDGLTGTLIDSEDQLAPAVARLLIDSELASCMGQRGRDWVQSQFPARKANSEWIRLFGGVLGGVPVRTVPFSVRRATLKDYGRAMVRFYRQLAE